MREEQWDELLKLREKVSLTPKTGHRLERLEDLIAYTRYLETYTPEETARLVARFKELSEQEQAELWNRATNKSNPSLFHLTHEESEKIRTARRELSFHERARLLSNLILASSGTAWLDPGEVFDAIIELDDRSSPARETRPYAHLYFSRDSRRRIETVDLLESVRSNPAAIGHPAVVFAIYHWQQVIYTRRVIERDDITSKDKLARLFKDGFGGGRDVRSAETNLKAISETLYNAAEKRAIPVESALALSMQQCDLLGPDEKSSVVYKAWETLTAKFIRHTVGPEEVLEKLKPELFACESELSNYGHITANRVMEYLGSAGKKFVWFNKDGNSPRRRWIVFRNAFAAWFFDLEQSTIQTYLEKAAKQNVVVDDIYQPSMDYPKTRVFNILRYLLNNPLVMAREPVVMRESEIGYLGVEEAIRNSSSDNE